MRKTVFGLALMAAFGFAASTPTLADPPGHARGGWKHGDDDDGYYRERGRRHYREKKHYKEHRRHARGRRHGGPPPWAPAHGYRRKYVTYYNRHHRRVRIEESALVVLPAAGLATCNHEAVGFLLGGGTGAAVGSQFGKGDGKVAAIIGGTVLGALIGGSVGRTMDRTDQHCIGQALERAETGRAVAWRNPDNGGDYQVTPTRTFQADGGQYCREYQTTIVVDGRQQSAYGRACRQPDGSWKRQ